MSSAVKLILFVLAIAVLVASQAVFTVNEREQAVRFRFGEIVKADYQPGLHFKAPFINSVSKFEDRILTRTNPTEEFLTNEKKNLFVDFFVKWRITNVAQFYRATGGSEEAGAARLIEIIKDGIRGEFAKRTVREVVSAERSELMDDMLEKADATASELGIAIVDVRVKRIDLPDEVSTSVYSRMRQERKRVADQLRAEGKEAYARIVADADRQRVVILAEAYRDAEQVRGEGDASSAEIYASAFELNPEFYTFFRSMQAYRNSIGNGDIMVLKPDSEFFRYLNRSAKP